jgi:hypothetical protein
MRQDPLNAEKEWFIESMGPFFERQCVPRIGGRILGPLSLSDMDALEQLCQDALAMPPPRNRHKPHETVEFRDFHRQEQASAAERWRARFTHKPGTQSPSPSSARSRRNASR